MVVGVTGESEDEVSAYIAKHEPKYPIAIGFAGKYDVTGIPHAFLIDKDGKIAWRGHPAGLQETQLTKLLVGARPATVCKGLEAVHELRRGEQFGEALKLADKLLAQGGLSDGAQLQAREWIAGITKTAEQELAAADAAEKDKDVYALWQHLDVLTRQYAGMPGVDDAKKRLDALMASKPNTREIEAGQRFAEAGRLEAALDYTAAMEIYKELGSRHGSTRAGRDAKARHRDLLKQGMLGFDASCTYCRAGEKACPSHLRKR